MTSKPNVANVSRRDLLKLAGVGAAAAILAPGCGAASGSDTAVSWQAIPSYSLQSTDPKRLDYLGQQRVAFEGASSYRLDPQVTSADTAAAMAKLLLQASQGRAPDIAQVDGYIFGRMAAYTQPLTDQCHLVALVSVTVANVWRGTALSMILCYAGLKTIPDEVYEATRIDGAGGVQTLAWVTLPMMLPILLTNLVLVLVETFNTFDMVLSLTGGGPGAATQVLALGVYDQIFRQLNVGRGTAMAVVLMLINIVMIAAYLRVAERQERTA